MARHYSTRDFFRHMPSALLARYFAGSTVFGEFDFVAMSDTRHDELFAAWLALSDAQRNNMDAEFRDIFEMSCEKGCHAILDEATRQLRGAWPFRYSALATDQSYRLTKMESDEVGCVATSAQRRSAGSAHGMTALVETADTYRAPTNRLCLPPSR